MLDQIERKAVQDYSKTAVPQAKGLEARSAESLRVQRRAADELGRAAYQAEVVAGINRELDDLRPGDASRRLHEALGRADNAIRARPEIEVALFHPIDQTGVEHQINLMTMSSVSDEADQIFSPAVRAARGIGRYEHITEQMMLSYWRDLEGDTAAGDLRRTLRDLMDRYRGRTNKYTRAVYEARMVNAGMRRTRDEADRLLGLLGEATGHRNSFIVLELEDSLTEKIRKARAMVEDSQTKVKRAATRAGQMATRYANNVDAAIERMPRGDRIRHGFFRRNRLVKAQAASNRIMAGLEKSTGQLRRMAPAAGLLGTAGTLGALLMQAKQGRSSGKMDRIQGPPVR